jgi:tetratricopeptide (TPR) repeat protein
VAPAFADFAGAAACAECHAQQHATWRTSTHGRAGGDPGAVQLLQPFDGTPIRFRDAVVSPRIEAGQFAFVIERAGRVTEKLSVDGVIGGGHMVGGGTQGFVTRTGDGTFRFLPFELARNQEGWFCNTGTRLDSGWLPITREMRLADCGDWPPTRALGEQTRFATCQQCHGSQIDVTPEPGKPFATRFASLAIDCESCHGPARPHIEAARNGAQGAELRMRSLATLSESESNTVCFSCHALKDAVRPGFLPGADLESYYSLLLPLLSDDPVFADGRIRTFAYQQSHLWSDCYLAGTMTCTDCHEPHGQGYRDVNGRPLAGRFDDGQCTGCHASKAVDITVHTRHAAASEGSRCVACHMPYLQEPDVGTAVRYARSDHTIPVPRPSSDAALGIEVACAQCHRDADTAALERQVSEGWGELKPRRQVVEALVRAGATPDRAALVELLSSDDGAHAAATFLVLGTLLRDHTTADAGVDGELRAKLEQLAAHAQPDIAAAALATLHLTAGNERNVRRFLVQRLDSLGSAHASVRRRWVVLLGFLGDRAREAGRASEAINAYRKALELSPEDPGVLANVGLAHAAARDLPSAIAAYRRSIAADSTRALTWVNLGSALAAIGDQTGAEQAQRSALRMNPAEPLAAFNLGNLYLRSNRAREAAEAYRQAVHADPGLAEAWFNLARALVASGELEGVADALRAGLEFDPDNTSARDFLQQLEGVSSAAQQR